MKTDILTPKLKTLCLVFAVNLVFICLTDALMIEFPLLLFSYLIQVLTIFMFIGLPLIFLNRKININISQIFIILGVSIFLIIFRESAPLFLSNFNIGEAAFNIMFCAGLIFYYAVLFFVTVKLCLRKNFIKKPLVIYSIIYVLLMIFKNFYTALIYRPLANFAVDSMGISGIMRVFTNFDNPFNHIVMRALLPAVFGALVIFAGEKKG
ncbi:MAG: hypothetical protein LBM87_02745 [Ruminococcus sp.]|jgi:hypothetical protein|nr:hypothetical protein [Ruminococcus sp.]